MGELFWVFSPLFLKLFNGNLRYTQLMGELFCPAFFSAKRYKTGAKPSALNLTIFACDIQTCMSFYSCLIIR